MDRIYNLTRAIKEVPVTTSEALTVVAVFRSRPGRERELANVLGAMLEPTRAEHGCQRYDLHRVDGDLGLFFFDEIWMTADDHATHVQSPHVQALLARAPDLYEWPIVEYKGRRIGD